jgi:subtilisin family serine protease/NAD-dependent dihydropyrimidine dehydrogenase PreA subunit
MAIAAVDANEQRASFSSTGQKVDVAAPGVAVLSTVPTGSCKLCDPSRYRTFSGTSMATPHVSGTGALLRSRAFTNLDAQAHIDGTAKDLGFPGFDLFYGWGRVDALAAVTKPPTFPPPGNVTLPTMAFVFPQVLRGVAADVQLAGRKADKRPPHARQADDRRGGAHGVGAHHADQALTEDAAQGLLGRDDLGGRLSDRLVHTRVECCHKCGPCAPFCPPG